MIKEEERGTEQLLSMTRDLQPLLSFDSVDYSWPYYIKNDTKGKDGVHWEYTKLELIGYKEEELYFKFPNGFTRPLTYKELERTYAYVPE